MKQTQHTNCFARQCLGHQKELLARELRKIIKDNAWSQKEAADILGIGHNLVGFICREQEWKISFDALYVACIYAGFTINLGVVVPN
jgi:predicted XRE-type DNA-binding protein